MTRINKDDLHWIIEVCDNNVKKLKQEIPRNTALGKNELVDLMNEQLEGFEQRKMHAEIELIDIILDAEDDEQ